MSFTPTKSDLIGALKETKTKLEKSQRAIRFVTEQTKNPPIAPYQLYRLSQVAALIGVSKRTIERWQETENFPRPYKIGPSVIAWRSDELEAWIAGRPRKQSSELQEWDAMTDRLEGMAKGLRS